MLTLSFIKRINAYAFNMCNAHLFVCVTFDNLSAWRKPPFTHCTPANTQFSHFSQPGAPVVSKAPKGQRLRSAYCTALTHLRHDAPIAPAFEHVFTAL